MFETYIKKLRRKDSMNVYSMLSQDVPNGLVQQKGL